MNDLFNKLLVFDLDDTLIDTQAIKDILFNFAHGLGCDLEQIRDTYGQIRDEGFTLEKYAAVLSNITQKPEEEILLGLRAEMDKHKENLLPKDVRDFLQLCKERGTKMRLLTFGASSWQAEKIEMLGLNKYFDEHLSAEKEDVGKLEELGKIVDEEGGDSEIVLFNDKLTEIVDALERYPGMAAYLRPIRLKDGELMKRLDPALQKRIEVLPNFRFLMSEIYVGNKK